MGAEEFADSHVAHIGAPKPWLLAVDAGVCQAKLLASLHPLQVHHHQKAIWENKEEGCDRK